jgi:hypothetical protein
MLHQTQLSAQQNRKSEVTAASGTMTYHEVGFLTFQDKREIRSGLMSANWQHISIRDVTGGNTEIHATKPLRGAKAA